MSGDPLTAAHKELSELFERTQTELDPRTSDNYQYDDGYTSGLAKALAIIESHLTPPDKGNSHE